MKFILYFREIKSHKKKVKERINIYIFLKWKQIQRQVNFFIQNIASILATANKKYFPWGTFKLN